MMKRVGVFCLAVECGERLILAGDARRRQKRVGLSSVSLRDEATVFDAQVSGFRHVFVLRHRPRGSLSTCPPIATTGPKRP